VISSGSGFDSVHTSINHGGGMGGDLEPPLLLSFGGSWVASAVGVGASTLYCHAPALVKTSTSYMHRVSQTAMVGTSQPLKFPILVAWVLHMYAVEVVLAHVLPPKPFSPWYEGRLHRSSYLCLDAYPSHQRFQSESTPDSPVPPYASDGPRDEDLRHRPSTDAAAGRDLRVTGHGPGTH
jgi:hypothetical protein